MTQKTRSVFTALVGRANVGKSSLMNRFLGEKVAIVTHKPQTTRARITGILTQGPTQYVFIDTPGVHRPRTRLGERMVSASRRALSDVDLVLMLFEPEGEINEAERDLIARIKEAGVASIAAVNKKDRVRDENALRERITEIEAFGVFESVTPVSALTGEGCDALLARIDEYSVEGPHFFDDDSLTDMPEKEIVAEIVREKLLLNLREEIPHGTNVEVESFTEREDGSLVDISVVIYCEKKSHKGMIIGKRGSMLKKIATRSRIDIEKFLETRVNLQCFVKVREGWRDSNFRLNEFGFRDEDE